MREATYFHTLLISSCYTSGSCILSPVYHHPLPPQPHPTPPQPNPGVSLILLSSSQYMDAVGDHRLVWRLFSEKHCRQIHPSGKELSSTQVNEKNVSILGYCQCYC